MGLPPPPTHGRAPVYPTEPSRRKSGGRCCRCICWCCCCFFLLMFLTIGASAGIYFYLNPKPPSYSITDLSVSNFDVSPDSSLYTKLSFTVRAENPNSKIGIRYENGSSVRLVYRDTDVCSGSMPSFYQDYNDVQPVKIEMEGTSKLDQGMQKALMADKEKGEVPFKVFVSVPVKVRVFNRNMNPVTCKVQCELVLDGLDPKKKTGIKSVKCGALW